MLVLIDHDADALVLRDDQSRGLLLIRQLPADREHLNESVALVLGKLIDIAGEILRALPARKLRSQLPHLLDKPDRVVVADLVPEIILGKIPRETYAARDHHVIVALLLHVPLYRVNVHLRAPPFAEVPRFAAGFFAFGAVSLADAVLRFVFGFGTSNSVCSAASTARIRSRRRAASS